MKMHREGWKKTSDECASMIKLKEHKLQSKQLHDEAQKEKKRCYANFKMKQWLMRC